MRTSLKPKEKILIIIRQHWLKLLLPFFVWLVVTVLLLLFYPTSASFIIILLLAFYPMYGYLNWKNNLWCVTNLRVVDESGFFSRYSKESPLDKIN